MRKRCLVRIAAFWALLIGTTIWAGAAWSQEAISISHSIKNYASEGPVVNITLTLEIQNTSNAEMSNVVIKAVPVPKDVFFTGVGNVESLSIGTLSAGATVSADYTMTSSVLLPQEEIASMPVLWEVNYFDGVGQEKGAIVDSLISTVGGGI